MNVESVTNTSLGVGQVPASAEIWATNNILIQAKINA